MFRKFIKSLEREENKSLIEAILKGYNVFLENESSQISYNPKIIKKIFPVKFLNSPEYASRGCMAFNVVQTKPEWIALVRCLSGNNDLNSVIAVARGKDLHSLTLDEKPLIQASEKWDELGCEDPTVVGNGFYYTGVEKDENGDIKANLCYSDLAGNKKLIKRYTDSVDMIKEAEFKNGDLYVEEANGKSYISTINLKEKLLPKKGTWYSEGLSTGPIKDDNQMFFNGYDGDNWRIGMLDLNKHTASGPIIWGGKICFSSGLGDNILFFHFDDKEIWGAELNAHSSLSESVSSIVKWRKPTLREEWDEIEFQLNDINVEENTNIPEKIFIETFNNSKLVDLTDNIWSQLENTDSWNIKKGDIETVKKLSKKYGRDINRILEGIKNNDVLPAPIVMKGAEDWYYLIGGNTRLMAVKALGIRPKVLMVDISKNIPLNEAIVGKGLYGNIYYQDLKSDSFIHFTSVERAKEIVESGKLLMNPPYQKFGTDTVDAISATLGKYVPGTQHTHIEGKKVAVFFKTDTIPDYGAPEEVVWHIDVNLINPQIISVEKAISILKNNNSPDEEDYEITYKKVENLHECIKSLLEYPSIRVGRNEVDFHIEDKLSIEGEDVTIRYVKDLIKKLTNNQPIHIDFTRGFEIKNFTNPKDKIKPYEFKVLLHYLQLIKNGLIKRKEAMIS